MKTFVLTALKLTFFIMFLKYKFFQIPRQKYGLIKFHIFPFARVQKGILTVLKYSTKKPHPNFKPTPKPFRLQV